MHKVAKPTKRMNAWYFCGHSFRNVVIRLIELYRHKIYEYKNVFQRRYLINFMILNQDICYVRILQNNKSNHLKAINFTALL